MTAPAGGAPVAPPKFDPTFNIGHLLTFGGVVGAALIGYGVMSGAVSNLDTRLLQIEENLAPVATATVVSDRRITWLENQTTNYNDAVIRIEAQIVVLRELVAELRANGRTQ